VEKKKDREDVRQGSGAQNSCGNLKRQRGGLSGKRNFLSVKEEKKGQKRRKTLVWPGGGKGDNRAELRPSLQKEEYFLTDVGAQVKRTTGEKGKGKGEGGEERTKD